MWSKLAETRQSATTLNLSNVYLSADSTELKSVKVLVCKPCYGCEKNYPVSVQNSSWRERATMVHAMVRCAKPILRGNACQARPGLTPGHQAPSNPVRPDSKTTNQPLRSDFTAKFAFYHRYIHIPKMPVEPGQLMPRTCCVSWKCRIKNFTINLSAHWHLISINRTNSLW